MKVLLSCESLASVQHQLQTFICNFLALLAWIVPTEAVNMQVTKRQWKFKSALWWPPYGPSHSLSLLLHQVMEPEKRKSWHHYLAKEGDWLARNRYCLYISIDKFWCDADKAATSSCRQVHNKVQYKSDFKFNSALMKNDTEKELLQ